MDQGLRLVSEQAFLEQFGLFGDSLVERQLRGRFDRVHRFARGQQAARTFFDRIARRSQRLFVLSRVRNLVLQVARLAWRLSGIHDLASECHGPGQQVAVNDPVDNARLQSFGRGHGITKSAHFCRHGHAGQPRQTLRAAGAGNDAQFALGLSDLRGCHGDAIVASHRGFQSAAKGRAMNGADDRLGAVLQDVEHRIQADAAILLSGSDFAELLDVGSGDERATTADEHDCGDRLVF